MNKKTKRQIIILLFALVCTSNFACAQDQETRLEVTLERKSVSLGNPVYLYFSFYGGQNIYRPEINGEPGLKINYVGPSTKMSIINGRVSQSVTYMYMVIPVKSGEFKIGPFRADYEGRQYEAEAVTLTVTDVPSQIVSGNVSSNAPIVSSEDRQTAQAGVYSPDNIFVAMDIPKKEVYINELVPVTIKLYINNMMLRDIEYPVYSHEGFSSEEFTEPERRQEIWGGIRYEVLVFRQNLFGIKEGTYTLGPSKIKCNILTKDRTSKRMSLFGSNIFDNDFFSGAFGYTAYPAEFSSKEIPVTILSFPSEQKPDVFQSAVGNFTMDVNISPADKVKVGDPVVVTAAISGEGNFDTVTAPQIKTGGNFKIYEAQASKKPGKKIYEQILIPKTDEIKEVPEVCFGFFDPVSKKYRVLKKGPFPIEVIKEPQSEKAVKMVSLPGEQEMFYTQEKLGKDIIYIKEKPGKFYSKDYVLYKNLFFLAGQVIPFFLFAVFFAARRKKEKILKDKGYARFLKAPQKARKDIAQAKLFLSKNDMAGFYDIVFRTLQNYLADRFNLPKGNVSVENVRDKLGSALCNENILGMLRDIFSKCEMVCYASLSSEERQSDAQRVLEEVKRIIDYMEKIKI